MIYFYIGNGGTPDNFKRMLDSEAQDGGRGKCSSGYMYGMKANSCLHKGRPKGLDFNQTLTSVSLRCTGCYFCITELYKLICIFIVGSQSTNFATLILFWRYMNSNSNRQCGVIQRGDAKQDEEIVNVVQILSHGKN